MFKRSVKVLLIILTLSLLSGCGVQSLPQAKNEIEASEAEIINQYKRRADLIPNLVNTVKGYASHEKETLQSVIEARAKATSTTLNVEDAQSLQKFQKAQGQLGQALSRLMVVAERYPNLKADQNFRELQAQIEGTENRITIARQRHIENIKQFNNLVTVPPTSWTNSIIYNFEKMPQWTVDNQEQVKETPKVEF